jgi:uncharacterized protein YjdB
MNYIKNKIMFSVVAVLMLFSMPPITQANTVLTNGGASCGIGSFRSCIVTLSDGSTFWFTKTFAVFEGNTYNLSSESLNLVTSNAHPSITNPSTYTYNATFSGLDSKGNEFSSVVVENLNYYYSRGGGGRGGGGAGFRYIVNNGMVTVTSTTNTPILTSVTVTLPTLTTTVAGTETLVAAPKDQNGVAFVGATTAFASSNPTVATVDSTTGLVTGVTAGTATITATSVSGSITVTGTAMVTVTSTSPGGSGHNEKDDDNNNKDDHHNLSDSKND